MFHDLLGYKFIQRKQLISHLQGEKLDYTNDKLVLIRFSKSLYLQITAQI